MKKLLLLLLIFSVCQTFAQEDSASSAVNFDFGLTRNKNVNLWPIFKRSKTKTTTEISALANLIGYQNNKDYQLKHGHVLPLFFNTKTASSRDIRLGTTYYPTLFRYTRDDSKQSKTYSLGEIAPYIRFLQLSTSKNGLEVDNNLFFFMWYNRSEIDKNTSFVTFPIVWYYKKPTSTYLTIAPFYSKGNFKGYDNQEIGSYKMITPLYWNFKNKVDTSAFLFPIFYSTKNGAKSNTTIFPLLYNRKVTPNKSSVTIFPVYHSTTNSENNELTNSKMITPLFWTKDTKNSKSRTLLPVFNYYKDSLEEHFISPIYAHKKDSFSSFTMSTPLIWNIENKYDTTNIIAPLYISQKSKDQKVSFIPLLLAWKKTYRNTISYNQFPLLFTSNDTLHKIKKQSIALLFYHKKTNHSKVTRLFPLFGYKKNENLTRFISPIYINSKKSYTWDSSYTKAILPIYLKTGNENRRFSTVFPVYWTYENANYKSIYVLPFGGFGKAKNEEKGFVNITPFYWQTKQPNKTKKMVLPVWYSSIEYRKPWQSSKDTSLPKIDTIKKSMFFPLLWTYRKNNERNLTLFPIYWSRKDAKSTHKIILPIYSKYDYKSISNNNNWTEKRRTYGMLLYHFKKQNNYNQHEEITSKHGFFPFYFYKNERYFTHGLDTNYNKHTILFPIYWSYVNKENSTINSKKIIFPLFWRSKDPAETKTMLLPLFSYRKLTAQQKELYLAPVFHWKRTDLDTTFSIFPIFQYKNSMIVKRNYFAPFYYYEQNKTDKKAITAITPFFWKIKGTDHKIVRLLPFIHYKQNHTDTTLSILPIFYKKKSLGLDQTLLFPIYFKRNDSISQKYTRAYTPLFWNLKNGNKLTRILFPIIDFTKNNQNNDIHMGILGFLFRYKSTQQEKSFKFLYPLIDYKKSNHQTTFRISPIFWMKKSTDLTYHTLIPIYYHQKTLNSTYFNLFAGLYSKKTSTIDNERSHRFLWSFIYHKKSDKGHTFRLGYFLYKNIENDKITEKGIFPLYSFESNSEGKKAKSYLLKCFQSNELPIEGTTEKYKEIKVFWFIRIGSNFDYLHEKGLM
jgi:hypothetical protein